MPVARGAQQDEEEFPVESVSRAAEASRNIPPEPQVEEDDPARGAAIAAAETRFGPGAAEPSAPKAGKRALVQYDYDKAEDNEIELVEGQVVTHIEMVDDDWWMGTNEKGESGLFPSNYVELVDEGAESQPEGGSGKTAVAQYDYEAAEENELSFPDGATIADVAFPDDDWWFGTYGGQSGLFPANYVTLNE